MLLAIMTKVSLVYEDYGIDWEGPISEELEESIELPAIDCPISEQDLTFLELCHAVDSYIHERERICVFT